MTTSSATISTRPLTKDNLRRFIHYAEFKRIFNTVEFALKKENFQSLAILSIKPEEGKTFMAAALALGFAELIGKKVLLVDASNPASEMNLDDVFDKHDEPNPNLEVILRQFVPGVDSLKLGSFRPLAHKAQEYRIQDIIAEYKNKYDIILFDSAALTLSNRGNFDPWVIAARTDASILINSGKTGDDMAAFQGVDALSRIKFLGVIENKGVA